MEGGRGSGDGSGGGGGWGGVGGDVMEGGSRASFLLAATWQAA